MCLFTWIYITQIKLVVLVAFAEQNVNPWVARDRVQFSSVAQSCLTLCDPMNRSTQGLPVHHQLPEFTQTHLHRVSDANNRIGKNWNHEIFYFPLLICILILWILSFSIDSLESKHFWSMWILLHIRNINSL